MSMTWNPVYLEYCATHGHPSDPEGMRQEDRELYPVAPCLGFILWAQARIEHW